MKIGSSFGYFGWGLIFFAIGFLLVVCGGLSNVGIAILFTIVGAGLLVVGFWVGLFRKVEERLIDVQQALIRQQPAGGE